MNKTGLIFLIIWTIATHAFAQNFPDERKPKALVFGIGAASHRGDLNDRFPGSGLVAVVGVNLNTSKKLHGNLLLSIGSTSGQQLDYTVPNNPDATPNTFFQSGFIGINHELHFNLVDREKFKFYLSQGVGVMRYVPKDQFGNELSNQINTRALNETYGNLSLMLPSMVGMLYQLPNRLNLGLQAGYYNTLTDYLDNISQWGTNEGSDNILSVRFQVSVPVNF